MKKLRRQLFAFFFLISLPVTLFATVQPTPNLDWAENYSGPIEVFWNCSGTISSGTEYYVFYSTLASVITALPAVLADSAYVDSTIVPYTSGAGMKASIYSFKGSPLVNGQSYHFRIAALHAGDWTAAASNTRSATSITQPITVTGFRTAIDGQVVSGDTTPRIDFDSSTIAFSCTLKGQNGAPFLISNGVKIDIKNSVDDKSIFSSDLPVLSVTVNISSTSFSAYSSTYTWDGSVFNHNGDKHNTSFSISAVPLDSNGSEVAAGKNSTSAIVDVVHINNGRGLVYTTLGTGDIHYGPPFLFDFYLSKSAFVTLQIWDKHQTADFSDDTLVRSVLIDVPKPCGDATAATADWNKNVFTATWEGRDENGQIVPNDIYYYTLSAAEFWNEPGSGYNAASTDGSNTIAGNIAFDVLRLLNITSTGITDGNPIAHIKYTLAGANSQIGGATVKIVICTPGTTFTMASSAGSASYNGGTYSYVAGDPLPTDPSRIRKTFVFARSAGSMDETWNGFDETGTGLPNNNYVFAIGATDDSGNHAIDNSGNDRIIVGNITIDRTAAQEAGDSTAPTVTGITIANFPLTSFTGMALTGTFNYLTVTMNDTESGVDLTGSVITLADPNNTNIAVSATNNGVDTVLLTFPSQSSDGTYTLRIRARDKVGNMASDVVATFILVNNTSGTTANAAPISSTMYAYPNPAKGVDLVRFDYTIPVAANVKLEVYSILGELLYEESWAAGAGTNTKAWSITNKEGTKLATGVYLYRLIDESRPADKKLKKLIIIQ